MESVRCEGSNGWCSVTVADIEQVVSCCLAGG